MTLFLKMFAIFFILMLPSMNYGQKKANTISLDIESNMKKMEIVNLSQFNADIRYVPFSSKGDAYFTPIDFDISNNSIVVTNLRKDCFLFNSEGEFISRIGKIGRGPEEYQYLNLMGFNSNNKIYIQSQYDLLEYNKDGSFVKKYSKCFLINNIFNLYNGFFINDSLILGHVSNTTGQIEYKALIVNKNGGVKSYSKNYLLFNSKFKGVDGMEGQQTHYYKFNNSVYYKEFYNDTLFMLNEKYDLVPKYSFNFGKFKEPLSDRGKLPPEREMRKFIYLSFVYQTKNYLYLDCEFADQYPAKNTPQIQSISGTNSKPYKNSKVLGIYDKKTNQLKFCKPTSTNNPLFTSGIYNDIDAGPRFFPRKQINDSTLVMWIEAKQLKDHVASNDFKNMKPKYPEKKKKLEELANSLNEFDNPVLMFVTFKK